MQFSLDQDDSIALVRGYDAGILRVQNETFEQNVIISPERVIPWEVQHIGGLNEAAFAPLFDLSPEIVLLGSGATLVFPDPKILAALSGRGIGLETMDTAAACRTYNILALEGRGVAAALFV